MTDEELIARLRERPFRLGFESEEQAKERRQKEREIAADRIEALVKERDEAKRLMQARHREMLAADGLMRKHQRRALLLEALLREARTDLEHYVTQEYPKHAHPYFERQWNRDMELCRRIDAALKGADHE